jgi:hypothetical protein
VCGGGGGGVTNQTKHPMGHFLLSRCMVSILKRSEIV